MATVGPYCLVVSNGVLQNSSDVFNILYTDTGGASTFSVKLSANGLDPATHWAAKNNVQIGGSGNPFDFITGLGLTLIIDPFAK